MAWRNMTRWLAHLEKKGELLRIIEPVDVELEAGAIADRLVKSGGKAVLFEKPRLPNGEISEIPLAMNLFGSHDRTLRALGASHPTEVGDRLDEARYRRDCQKAMDGTTVVKRCHFNASEESLERFLSKSQDGC
jgi:UbiD family decarboxylase